jgi:prostaglandin-endoperoxide synthase 2
MSFADLLADIAIFIVGKEKANRLAINRLIGRARTRPHPWSTRDDGYVSWAGLTDKSWFSRLLPAVPLPIAEGVGTARPPIDEVAKLFTVPKGQQLCCSKSTTLFPAFAQYLTDGFLRTRMFNTPPGAGTRLGQVDRRRTTSNHEIDLSSLYGRTEEQTDVLRSRSGGTLKSQTINGEEFPPYLYGADGKPRAEFRGADGLLVLDEPLGVKPDSPGRATLFAVGGDRVNASIQVCTINTLLLREHNRLAAMLARAHRDWDDERLFQTARNILIVMFIRIVVHEYINHISSAPFRLAVDPSITWDAKWNRPNWMTIEFTLLYRWHSLVPEQMQWNGQPIGTEQMLLNNKLLIDGGLANALVQLSTTNAAHMRLGNIAWFLADAEKNGIEQGRINRVQGYNAYRRAMKLDPAKSFADIVGSSKDPTEQARRTALADRLKALYGHVDNVEFYVGLFAEPCEKNGPVPELVLAMVAMDAFSQALPNPLLSEHIWNDQAVREITFSAEGLAEIDRTNSLRDILERQTGPLGNRFVGMTRADWKRS